MCELCSIPCKSVGLARKYNTPVTWAQQLEPNTRKHEETYPWQTIQKLLAVFDQVLKTLSQETEKKHMFGNTTNTQ